jgi:hypothetical protein
MQLNPVGHHREQHLFHVSGVRIVEPDEVEEATLTLLMLFPHEFIRKLKMRCGHCCMYVADAPAGLVAERIAEHLREVEHLED